MTEPTPAPDFTAAMELALEQARRAARAGDVPVGAVLLDSSGDVVAADRNRRQERNDPTAHAEVLVLSGRAMETGSWRLTDHTLVVTLEPCPMCAGATVLARIARIVYGAADPKAGAVWSLYNIPQDKRLNHRVDVVEGVLAEESGALLSAYFADRRAEG